jgi:hypothetical protein
MTIAVAPFDSTEHQELEFIGKFIGRLEGDFPARAPTTAQERGAQEAVAEELARRGLEVERQPFRFSRSLYSVIALHCGIAVLGSACYPWQPWLAAGLQTFAMVSYLLDCHYRGYWLRRLFPQGDSQNIIARLPSAGTMRRRIVFIAHADAAPAGWMFSPFFLWLVHQNWPERLCLLRKQMFGWTAVTTGLVALDVICGLTGYWFPILYYIASLSSAVPLVLLTQMALSRQISPGANDNLSGCAALVLLSERLSRQQPEGVEIYFVVAGCEESGRGGAWALARRMHDAWDRERTIIIGLDMVSGGVLRYHVEGEVVPIWPSANLQSWAAKAAAGDNRFDGLKPYYAAGGATDAAPFLCHGYDGLCLVRIDPRSDLPSWLHTMDDCAANILPRDIRDAVDYAERLLHTIE